jgi:hypothetical protein
MYVARPQSPSAPVVTPIAPSAAPVQQPGAQPMYWNAPGQVPGSQYAGMWNWGAFLLCPIWLMNHGRPWRGILYIVLSLIPVVGFASLGMAIAYGIKGNEVAASSRRFTDDAQFVAVQNAWRSWGFGVTAVVIVIVLAGASMHGS